MKYLPLITLMLFIFCSSCNQTQSAASATDKSKSNQVIEIVDNHAVLENGDKLLIEGLADDQQTVFFLLRHAEKITTGESRNPDLTKEGYERAERLKKILKKVKLDMICSTDYKRTLETVRASAVDQDVPYTTYTPQAQQIFIKNTLKEKAGSNVLLVGHSNTIPNAVDIATNTKNNIVLTEKDYDNLYVVSVKQDGSAKLLSLKF